MKNLTEQNQLDLFDKAQAYLMKEYGVRDVHAGCYLCNFGTDICDGVKCDAYETCKQFKVEKGW